MFMFDRVISPTEAVLQTLLIPNPALHPARLPTNMIELLTQQPALDKS